ncbi:MAG: hypothetical protein ACR2NZ_06110, partial [Rubripirellula sp.]
MTRSFTQVAISIVSMLVAICLPTANLMAGLGPENVIVVVNADSHASRTIANHYVQLRQIPSSNVIFLEDVPTGLLISLEDFKTKILRPVFSQLDQRRGAAQARVVAYSADFPTSVNISEHTRRLTAPEQKKYQKPIASISGLTYLYQFVLSDSERYLDWGSNLYARGPFARTFANPFLDESRRQQFDAADEHFKKERFSKAADEFEKLYQAHPTISALAIRAAEAKSQLGDSVSATQWIERAVKSGWQSGRYLDEHETFDSLKDGDQLKAIRSRLSNMPIDQQPPVSFAANVGWSRNGSRVATNDGVPYMMSCMLAVVHDRGSSVEQAVQVLRRAGESDHAQPDGEFWFTSTADIRTKTRLPAFGDARSWLHSLGHDVELLHTNLPERAGNCVGLMLGTPSMKLEDRNWEFTPGAIAENLTSLSGKFDSASQSKITNL